VSVKKGGKKNQYLKEIIFSSTRLKINTMQRNKSIYTKSSDTNSREKKFFCMLFCDGVLVFFFFFYEVFIYL
jgi:hypothetical protein